MPRMRMWLDSLGAYLEDRIGFDGLRKLAKKKDVPVHRHTHLVLPGWDDPLPLHRPSFGTGVLLLFYYRPSAEEAYESIQFLMAEVTFGWLVRSIHHWAANLMIVTLFLHCSACCS